MELCLSGASHRGIYELGSLKALEEAGILRNVKKAVGTSIGAIILCLYIIGYTVDDIFDEIYKTDTQLFAKLSLANSIFEMQFLKDWILSFIKKRCLTIETITTLEFYNKYNVIFITPAISLEKGLEYISHITEPNMKIIDQLISTISIPFVFSPNIVGEKTYIDGGLLDNYSIGMLDTNSECIGIIVRCKQIPYVHTGNIVSFIKRVLALIEHTPVINEHTIVLSIEDSDIIDFNLSIDDKVNMFRIGYNLTIESSIYNKFLLKRHSEKYQNTLDTLYKPFL